MKKPEYNAGTPLNLEELSPEQLSYLSESELAQIVTDPRYKDAQLAALRALEERSTKGLTAEDEADMYKLQRNVSTQNRGRMGAIQNNMAVRGMSGSGMDALMQMQANQDATDREALAAMEKAGQIQSNKLSATQQLGQMGTQLRNQDFTEQSAKAQAQDAINRFNTSTRNSVLTGNNQTRNQGTTQNWNRGNEVNDKNTEASYAHDLQQENERRLRDEENRRRKGATAGMIGGIVGGAAGSYFGPTGTAAGYGVGSQIGQTISGYAYGGIVEPDMDDPANDTVLAKLSPGEAVIPRSAMSSEEMFKDYTNRLKQAVKERQGKVADAENNVKNAQYGSVFANALNDFSKGNRKDTILLNNVLKDPSGKPTVREGEYNTIKDTWTDPAKEELARQDKGLSQDKADFSQSENMRNYLDDKKRKQVDQGQDDWRFGQEQDKAAKSQELSARENDPNSQESKLAQSLAKKMAPSADFSNTSAARIKELLPTITKMYDIESDRLNQAQSRADRDTDRAIRLDQQKGANAERERKAKEMSATDTKYITQLQSGMKAVDGMVNALNKGDNTFSLIGDNDFTRNARVAAEMYGRLQSGGAINKDEEDRFMRMLPGPTDSSEQQQKKLMQAKEYYNQAQANFQKGRPDLQVNPQGNDLINGLQLPGQKIEVSNGTETLNIDPADLADAEADGFKRTK
jgi:hypothetical protein